MATESQQIHNMLDHIEVLENYFRNTIIPQLFVDAELVLRKYTPPAMKQFRLKEEFIGRPLEEIRENFRFPTILDNIKIVIATGKALEKEIQTTDMRWYQMNILPYIVRKENRTNGVIITFVDITARIRDRKELEKLVAEHELLLDTIAHDIKNPLLALGLTIEVFKRLSLESMEDFELLLGNAESSLTQLKKVINDLVESRWDDQRYQAAEELIDLQNIIEDVRLTLASQIQESNEIIKEDIHISEIMFSRRKLRSIIYNLLSNAIKYTPAGRIPEIIIRSYSENGYMVISISDNGIGIREEERDSIFEKFKRIRSSVDGSGVGLYLVNTIVSAAGGKITIESKEDQGSVFNVFLKLDKGQPHGNEIS